MLFSFNFGKYWEVFSATSIYNILNIETLPYSASGESPDPARYLNADFSRFE